jgi:hypothetical protein
MALWYVKKNIFSQFFVTHYQHKGSVENLLRFFYRAALGNYVECNSATWKDSCNTDMHIRSSFGSFGFYAWLDRKMEYYGVLGTTVSTGTDSAKFIDSIRADIEAVLATLPPVSVTPPTGSTQPTTGNNPNAQTSSASIEIRTFAVCLLALLALAL